MVRRDTNPDLSVELGLGLMISCLPALKHLLVGHTEPLTFKNAVGYLPSMVIKSIKFSSKRNSLSKGHLPLTTTMDRTLLEATAMETTLERRKCVLQHRSGRIPLIVCGQPLEIQWKDGLLGV